MKDESVAILRLNSFPFILHNSDILLAFDKGSFLLSTSEIYLGHRSRRVAIVASVIALCVCIVLVAMGFVMVSRGQQRVADAPAPDVSSGAVDTVTAAHSWSIRGALSETCTCAVPCTCNFGEGPSPHAYCYPFYSYDIRQGNYGETKLDGLHFGSADMKSGRTIFIDARADERQRAALRLIAMRVIEHVNTAEAEAKAVELASHIRYAAIKQEYDDRHNHLSVEGIGEFSADYIMGMDNSQPLVVRNNTTWRIRDAIKAKTSIYRVHIGRDVIDTKKTNSNQGEFEYTDKTDFGGPAEWNCGMKSKDEGVGMKDERKAMSHQEGGCMVH
jgi:hypothetical protein